MEKAIKDILSTEPPTADLFLVYSDGRSPFLGSVNFYQFDMIRVWAMNSNTEVNLILNTKKVKIDSDGRIHGELPPELNAYDDLLDVLIDGK